MTDAPTSRSTAVPSSTSGWMKQIWLLWTVAALGTSTTRAAFNEPAGQRRQQTYRVLEFEHGSINQRFEGSLRYYCTFRGKWNEQRHPNDFPQSASWSAPVLISHSNGYRMWTGEETATLGVESIAEEGFATIITNEFNNAGFETLQMVVGERMFNTSESQHLPPINVTFEHPWLSSMVKPTPSPDWFAGFSDFRTISLDTETYFNRIVIQSFVWDSGTDAGQTYTALDRDLDPQLPVERIRANSVPPMGQFLSPDGSFIPIPAEFECVLRVGEGPVIPGLPFNESHVRPPLYVPRDDDWIGNPGYDQIECAAAPRKCSYPLINGERSEGSSGAPRSTTATGGIRMLMTMSLVGTLLGATSLW